VTDVHAELAGLGVATVYEASGRQGLVDVPFVSVVPGARVAGPARVVRCGPGDNRAVHEVMAQLEPGEVLVLTMSEPAPVALLGELLATQAQARGAVGVVVDAAVRDTEDLRELGLPVWARWVRVAGATKQHRGSVTEPVVVGGATVRPGDVVVADPDGVVVVAAERVAEVLSAARARRDREVAMRARFSAGELSYDIYGMRAEDATA
jgi:4-hydroxy-4-methyl-2-oxoglutarate aldolase